MDPTVVRVEISGRVQGVWFRGWTVKTATALGLAGWVRNRREGSVEATLVGSASAVQEMVRRCREGPGMARVDDVRYLAPDPEDAAITRADGFRQRPTV